MVNVTFAVDDDTLRRARIHALEHGTSLNSLVRQYLEGLVQDDPSRAAGQAFVARAKSSNATSGPRGRTWRRDELYDS